jgi:hypothetical protein
MSGAIHPLTQYAFMAWCLVKTQGQLYLLKAEAWIFFLHLYVETSSGAHPASYPMGTGGSFPESKYVYPVLSEESYVLL